MSSPLLHTPRPGGTPPTPGSAARHSGVVGDGSWVVGLKGKTETPKVPDDLWTTSLSRPRPPPRVDVISGRPSQVDFQWSPWGRRTPRRGAGGGPVHGDTGSSGSWVVVSWRDSRAGALEHPSVEDASRAVGARLTRGRRFGQTPRPLPAVHGPLSALTFSPALPPRRMPAGRPSCLRLRPQSPRARRGGEDALPAG